MDKKAWIAVSLSVLGLVLWNFYVASHPPPRPPTPAATTPPPVVEPVRREAVGDEKAPSSAAAPPTVPVEERFETLHLPGMDVRFTNLGGGIADVTLLGRQHYVAETGEPIKLNANGHIPIGALSDAARPGGERTREPYDMRRESDGVMLFERTTPEGLRVTKRFIVRPAPDGKGIPTLDLDVTVANPGPGTARGGDYFLHAGSTAPIHRGDAPDFTEFAWWRDGKIHEHTARAFDPSSKFFIFPGQPGRTVIEEPVDRIGWFGVKNQFYTTIVTPAAPEGKEAVARALWVRRFELPPIASEAAAASGANNGDGAKVFGLDAAASLPGYDLPPNGSRTDRFQIYAGPTYYSRLADLGRDQDEILKYGWSKPVSVFLLNTMNWLQSRTGSYAVAILLMTLLIKAVTFYPQWRAMESGRRMAALAPIMNQVREKYKDDPAKAQTETLKLYKEYGVNPLGGCLPALIQMPIFFGFFRMLGTAAELRNSSFFWAHDLTQPDTVARVFGYSLNILPLLYAGTMFWQLSLTPKPADPQAAQQQKVMMFIPLIFVFFFYNFAAALSLYYTAQNILQIIQLYLTRHRPLPVLQRVDPTKRPPGRRGGGFSNLLTQLQEANAKANAAKADANANANGANGRGAGGGKTASRPAPTTAATSRNGGGGGGTGGGGRRPRS